MSESKTVKTPKTEAASAAKKAKLTKEEIKAKVQAKRDNFAKVIAFAKAEAERSGNVAMLNLIAQFEPKTRAVDGPRWTNQLRQIFGDQSTCHENEIWNKHKVGREEMRSLIKEAVVREKPEHRMWVVFDLPNGTYRVLGVGPNKPENWPVSSPLPKDMK